MDDDGYLVPDYVARRLQQANCNRAWFFRRSRLAVHRNHDVRPWDLKPVLRFAGPGLDRVNGEVASWES